MMSYTCQKEKEANLVLKVIEILRMRHGAKRPMDSSKVRRCAEYSGKLVCNILVVKIQYAKNGVQSTAVH